MIGLGGLLFVFGLMGLFNGFGGGVVFMGIGALLIWAGRAQESDNDIRHKNDYGKVTKCPFCGSDKVYLMTWDDKRESVSFWGAASSKFGKGFHCDNCGKEW